MQDQGWLDDFQRRVDEMQAKSLALQETLSTAEGRARSADGLVTVSVTPGGALKELQIDDRALRHGGSRLTALIMETYGKAQRQVSRDVLDAFEPIAGGSEVMDMVKSFMPAPEEEPEPEPPAEPPRAEPPRGGAPQAAPPAPDAPPGRPTGASAPNIPPAATPQPASPEQPRPTSGPHRRRAAGEDDDEMDPW